MCRLPKGPLARQGSRTSGSSWACSSPADGPELTGAPAGAAKPPLPDRLTLRPNDGAKQPGAGAVIAGAGPGAPGLLQRTGSAGGCLAPLGAGLAPGCFTPQGPGPVAEALCIRPAAVGRAVAAFDGRWAPGRRAGCRSPRGDQPARACP